MIKPLVRRAVLAAAACAVGVVPLAGCVTTIAGSAGYAPGSALPSASADQTDPQQELKNQCAVALTTAKGFLDSWKSLASSGITPTADERDQLAVEVQGYIDQLNAQLPTITDATLVSNVQLIVGEMSTIVDGLSSGIAVELTSYRTAVNETTDYCDG